MVSTPLIRWGLERGLYPGPALCAQLAGDGRLAELRWVMSVGGQWDGEVCTAFARRGDWAAVHWAAVERGCPWDGKVCAAAARRGDQAALAWARAAGCAWDSRTCMEAAAGGHLAVLAAAREAGCEWTSSVCAAAAGGHLPVLEWARAQGPRAHGTTGRAPPSAAA
jgi:hypothetical protein